MYCLVEGCKDPIKWEYFMRGGGTKGYSCEPHASDNFNKVYESGMLARPYQEGANGEAKKVVTPRGATRGKSRSSDSPGDATREGNSNRGLRAVAREGGRADPDPIRPGGTSAATADQQHVATVETGGQLSPYQVPIPYASGGTLDLSKEQQAKLTRPVDPLQVEVRPDGLIYIPWGITARVFTEVFGAGGWALAPRTAPMEQDSMVFAHMVMLVGGKFAGEAIGEQKHSIGYHKLSYAMAYEGAVSDAITRLSKRLGMWLELWDRRWVKTWLDTYAVRVQCRGNRPGWYWRRTDDPPLPDEILSQHQGESEYDRPVTLDHENARHMDSLKPGPYRSGSADASEEE